MKLAFDPPVSEAQRKAMWAAARGHSTLGISQKVGKEFVGKDMSPDDWRSFVRGFFKFIKEEAQEPEHSEDNAAGVMVTAPNSSVLFMRRKGGDQEGTWAFPGGGAEGDETPEQTALRELEEETGYQGGGLEPLHQSSEGVNYHTFLHRAKEQFEPKMNKEHSEYRWADLKDPPQPLHPGVKRMLEGLGEDALQGEVIDLPKDARGLFKKPDFNAMSDKKKQQFAVGMQKRRMEAAMRAHFADETSGLANTRDDLGGYLCRSGPESRGCNGEVDGKCIKVKLNRSDLNDPKVFFSCDLYDRKCVGDPELNKPTIEPVKAGVAEAKRPYGCKNCSKKEPCLEFVDQFGRDHWCGEWGMTMRLDDCCGENDNPTLELNDDGSRKEQEPTQAQDSLAFDRASVRSIDSDGRLHVAITNISKANICEYYGREIPNYVVLGLDPNRRYKLLRDPDELEKAASTFNGIQVLRRHIPVTADDPKQWDVVGATGTDASFERPYLKNSLSVWTQEAIDAIESGEQEELSCAYRYTPDMTPGRYEGETYDGVMRDIIGNHVALVKKGRAGPDVVVGDSAIDPITTGEAVMPRTRLGTYVHGALSTFFKKGEPAKAVLALDSALGDVTSANFVEKKPVIKAAITGLKTAGLAVDADLDGMHSFIDRLDKPAVEDAEVKEVDDDPENTNDGDPEKFLRGKLSAEDKKTYDSMRSARDAAVEEERKKKEAEDRARDADTVKKPAMDAAIAEAKASVVAEQKAIREAERFVQPWVGNLQMAFDSAEQVHRHTLDLLKVPHKDIHTSALQAVINAQPKPNARPKHETPTLAADAAATEAFNKRFPGAAAVIVV